jgi:hypothetical protein
VSEYHFPPKITWVWFAAARTLWQQYLWWLPFLQFEVTLRTPQDYSGVCVPWWFPSARVGWQNIKFLDTKKSFVCNAEAKWLGVDVGVGVAMRYRK